MTHRRSNRAARRARRWGIFQRVLTINGFLYPWLTDALRPAFRSGWLRWLGPLARGTARESPWILWAAQIMMLLVIGTTGVVVPGMPAWFGHRWMVWVEGRWMGGWGWCTDA